VPIGKRKACPDVADDGDGADSTYRRGKREVTSSKSKAQAGPDTSRRLPAPRVALLHGTARTSPFLCANTASGEFAPETPILINSLYLEVIDPSDLR
jgi:hypothetical protein